jgi:HlyD family secretion protein
MDFDKLLGDTATSQIVEELGIDKLIAEAATNDIAIAAPAEKAPPQNRPPQNVPPGEMIVKALDDRGAPVTLNGTVVPQGGPTGPGGAAIPIQIASGNNPPPPREKKSEPAPPKQPTFELPSTSAVDFEKYANLEILGDGEAKQKLRKLDDDLQVAQKELGQATATLDGTKRLFEKGFVTKNDLQRDEIAYDNSRLKVQTAETARSLHLKYDFAKSTEESLSKFLDAVREFDKTRRQAISKLAQAEARLKSAMGQHSVQTRQRKDLQDQRDKCVIHAKKSGLVVYGSGRDDMMYYGDQERIREGATVRERQAIITIPDMTRMSVNVKIHETYIKKVVKGQKVRITVDAFPDKPLSGEVTKVGVLPDSQNRWMNPDLKVYGVTIAIDSTQDWVKPGMSAKVEIMVNRLDNVVQIPVQAVTMNDGHQVCYVAGGMKPERREVEVGEFTDEFIEIKSGLKEGERVLLRTPDGVETDSGKPKEVKPEAPKADKTAESTKPAQAAKI